MTQQAQLPAAQVPGLWKHDWRPVQFTLVLDDSRVKFVGKEHAMHLKAVM